MTTTRERGGEGENQAREYLERLGYHFITANWQCKAGEIDLIMQDGEVRVLVEVRRRVPTLYGSPDDTVGWQKQRKLIRTARWYQSREHYWGDLRFDVIAITDQPNNKPPLLEHITDAFSA